ncbi:hypothetical protein [Phenylobacterium sp.]|uniref:hypothetical protein n=1 Tax=Phenylobacterium sp. TaxID=1871053 RepID=UPI003567B789
MRTLVSQLILAAAPLAAGLILAHAGPARAQAVSSADVNIVSVTGAKTPKAFTCTAVINNQNDDDSRQTRVIVLLPLQVQKILAMKVAGGPGHCVAGPALGGFTASATCDLGQLPQGPTVRRTVTIATTNSTAAPNYPQTCSAFIMSAVGDIDKRNNYLAAAPVP